MVGSEEEIRLGGKVNRSVDLGLSPSSALAAAARLGQVETVRHLISRGADPRRVTTKVSPH